ncbi:glyoxalase superfamily protein [Phytoactinopolyspora mesophila]|uniref:Bleomycin resistance protein n=1 Tax=Phytoactinopolyspora mesophila TaxID=2650750 RepID=A0A7K3M842_9ACTN|nr:glyoxalase superfamily protein [Phytoactinopolyspora mesophila]NDL59501.1 bleomycin resistance family protein [Phytoactinopolyspora mesophila]
MHTTPAEAKAAARALRRRLADNGINLSHSQVLEIVASQLGFPDWNTAHAALAPSTSSLGAPVPVLRIHDETIARAFYLDYLGFMIEWEHRFEPGMPLYLRIHRDRATLDLSEHHGDGTPGSVIWIPLGDLEAFHAELTHRRHPRLRPGIDRDAPGGPTMEITDPFGNTLRFCEPQS